MKIQATLDEYREKFTNSEKAIGWTEIKFKNLLELESWLREKLTQARAEERERVVGEIENLDRHSDSRCAELECSEDGYTNGLDDVLALIRAELTNKD